MHREVKGLAQSTLQEVAGQGVSLHSGSHVAASEILLTWLKLHTDPFMSYRLNLVPAFLCCWFFSLMKIVCRMNFQDALRILGIRRLWCQDAGSGIIFLLWFLFGKFEADSVPFLACACFFLLSTPNTHK